MTLKNHSVALVLRSPLSFLINFELVLSIFFPWLMLLNLKETSPKFITTLFTVAKSWKQPGCPSKNERKERKVYTCNRIGFSL